MKFNSIAFENYRCFVDGRVDFEQSGEKNINLLIGPNGGGKTELLFSFWWVLYGFDFKNLQNKEATPYALNCDLYRNLEMSSDEAEKKCSVTVVFEHNDVVYEVKKTAKYIKTGKKITVNESRTFCYYKSNGEKTLPVTEDKTVDKELSKIIPKAILNGILFDGERMKKLSSVDDNSKLAIKGTINDITNVALLEKCKQTYNDVVDHINKRQKKIKKPGGFTDIDSLNSEISRFEKVKAEREKQLTLDKDEYAVNEARLDEIKRQLSGVEEVKAHTTEKKQCEADIKKYKNDLDKAYLNFATTLTTKGYLFVSEQICNDINNLIEKYKVPEGLTVEAVNSIIAQGFCICGNPLTEKEIKTLNELKEILPPDNLNTTLSEAVRKIQEQSDEAKKEAKKDYATINECESILRELNDRKEQLSKLILDSDVDKAKELETESVNLTKRQGSLEKSIADAEAIIPRIKANLKKLREDRDSLSAGSEELRIINKQIVFAEKCLAALSKIEEINKNKALTDINKKIFDAYNLLSEDANLGRRIHIVQYDQKMKYQMVVYRNEKAEAIIKRWKTDGQYNKYVMFGLSDDEIIEKAILSCVDANSTGQGKMNTLAFAKAILDYSNQEKTDEGFEIRKVYPLLIDAPFSDIAGDNLTNSARELHNFSEQVILMIDSDKYGNVEKWIGPYVSTVNTFHKTDNKNVSKICRERE